ncbi:glutamine amidotransferase [Novipirellula caenicola]|uniref:Putative glutamine amidotransferase domain-containing protein n=1 Tax=Novipirellula caenicola TaxID=1536901 RepID=A0ABP9VJI3_9BACT
MSSFLIEPIYHSAFVATLVSLLVVVVLVLVTPPTENPKQRRWLIGLRFLAAFILMLAIFRPGFVQTDTRPAEATLVVAVDTSRSMTFPDDDRGDRWTHQQQAWQQLAEGLSTLDESMSVRLLGYDKTASELENTLPSALDNRVPTGDLTDLAAAATAAIAAAQGQPLAGVVIMGDGAQTAPIDGTGAERIAQMLKTWGVPLWTIPIGPAGGQSANRDVGIDALPESFQLFAKNEFDVNSQVQLRGLAGTEVPLRVRWIDEKGNSTVAAERQLVAEKANEVKGMSLQVIAPAPGIYRLNVEVDPVEGELVTSNNLQTAFVNVREGGGRILYLEGAPRLEQTYLRAALRRFPDLDLTYQWIPSDTSARWPIGLRDWFQKGKFDIYIIGDLDADAIGREQLSQLAQSVSDGAGLVMLGGYHNYDAGGYANSPLADVLPVEMDASRRISIQSDEVDNPRLQIPGPITIKRSRSHPITNIGGDDPDATWSTLPRLLGANRFVGPKVSPGVQVLLETADSDPLLVVGEYGRGRTAAVAFDSTWRWWREGRSEAYRRYWRQLALWLLSREEDSGDRIFIELDSRRFANESEIGFRARLSSLTDEPAQVKLTAAIIDENNRITAITDTASSTVAGEQTVSGMIPNLEPGYYRLQVAPANQDAKIKAETLAFQVIDQSREMLMPMADPGYLRQLAEITKDHGGAAFSHEEIDQLIQQIAERRHQAEAPVVEKQMLGDDPVSGWLLFVLFAGALSTEWYLRRRWGLV